MTRWGGALGDALLGLPDGETGYRRMWMEFLCFQVFEPNPAIETLERPPPVNSDAPEEWREAGDDWISLGYDKGTWLFRVREQASDIRLGELGYAREALSSYETFKLLRESGKIDSRLRFEVSIPLHDSSLRWYMQSASDVEALWDAYTDAVHRDLASIFEHIPAEDLVIQWDACAETLGYDENTSGHWKWRPDGSLIQRFSKSMKQLSSPIPKDVCLGVHLCYGSFGEAHLVEPTDLRCCVELADAAAESTEHQLNYVHMPVPIGRCDDSFFKPLTDLQIGETKLYLGLVHDESVEANVARYETARRYVAEFGVAAECGFGRASQDDVPGLIAAHRALVDHI